MGARRAGHPADLDRAAAAGEPDPGRPGRDRGPAGRRARPHSRPADGPDDGPDDGPGGDGPMTGTMAPDTTAAVPDGVPPLIQHHIDGRWTPSADGASFAVTEPVTNTAYTR